VNERLVAVLLGGSLGLGLLLVVGLVPAPRARIPVRVRLQGTLAEAGWGGVRPGQVGAVTVAAAMCTFLLVLGASGAVSVSLVFAALAGAGPWWYVRHRARRRQVELRELWPDVIDNLASAVRAGLSLPEALTQVADRGPLPLRPAFRAFADDYRVSGRFGPSLDVLKAQLADPVGDRIVEALRLAREVGGHDLGRLLRTLSSFLRDDARTRGEIRSRQSWTVNAARLAVAAPWILLALLAMRPRAVAAYDSTTGVAVLVLGAVVSFVAYRLMLRIARLPVEQRVLR
jgi:tight adherence protein B